MNFEETKNKISNELTLILSLIHQKLLTDHKNNDLVNIQLKLLKNASLLISDTITNNHKGLSALKKINDFNLLLLNKHKDLLI